MAYEKHYIGKGKQVKNLDIVKTTIKLSELQRHAYEYDGEIYVTFEISKLKQADKFKNTHTVYVSKKEAPEPIG